MRAWLNGAAVVSVVALAGGCAATSGTDAAETRAADRVIDEPPLLPPPPAEAPAGFKWVLNRPYSDEFDGDALDTTKWKTSYAGWPGRPPGLFVPEAVSVADGELQIRVGNLDPARPGPNGEPDHWTIQCGAVQSREMGASYGFYEARIKASSTSTSTTFWMKHENLGNEPRPYKQTELDVLEAIGNAQTWPGFKTTMHFNTHQEFFPEDASEETVALKEGGVVALPEGETVNGAFRNYGVWWVDANTMHFYLDGERVATVEPPTDRDPTPFDQKMFLNMVCETYDWEVNPTPEELAVEEDTVARYDWVRSWTLVRDDASATPEAEKARRSSGRY